MEIKQKTQLVAPISRQKASMGMIRFCHIIIFHVFSPQEYLGT